MGTHRCFVNGGEEKKVRSVFPWRGCLLHCLPRVNGVFVVLEVAVGVVAATFSMLTLVDGFGEILQL